MGWQDAPLASAAPAAVAPRRAAPANDEPSVLSGGWQSAPLEGETGQRAVVYDAAKNSADKAAEATKLARRFGVPDASDVFMRTLDEVRHQAAVDDADAALRANPKLARAVSRQPSIIRIGHDDVSNLTDITKAVQKYGELKAWSGLGPQPGRTLAGTVGDVAVTALKSAVGLPQAYVGLVDLFTGGYYGRSVEQAGVKFDATQELLNDLYSPAQKHANATVAEAQGFIDTLQTMLSNPSTIATSVGESAAQMLGGAGVGRALISASPRLAPWLAAAIGEGVMGAGQSAEQLRQGAPEGLLGLKQTLAAAGSGTVTAVFGAVGGKAASKFGLADIDTALVKGGLNSTDAAALRVGFTSAVVKQGISEGVFEELPQSVQEQMWQNWAIDRPLSEGVGKAAAQGLLSGAAMGGGFQAVISTLNRQARAERAQAQVDNLVDVFKRATESKVRERDPETFAQLVQQMSDEGQDAPTAVYVDARRLAEEVLTTPEVQEVFNQMGVSPEQIAEAQVSGGAVEIPIGELLAKAAGTPLEQALLPHLRSEHDGLSQVELKDQAKESAEFLQTAMEEEIAKSEKGEEIRASADAVYTKVFDQLQSIGRNTKDVNEAYASLVKAFYGATSQRLNMTPEQMFEAYPLRIRGETVGPGYTAQDNGPLTVEGYHYSKEDRPTLTTGAYGTGLKGSSRDEYLNAADKRLSKRAYFYADKGTGINPESGVGGRAHRVQLTNVYDSNKDPLALKKGPGGKLGFESRVLDAGFSGYLDRLEGTQSGQVIMLGDQTFRPELLGAQSRIESGKRVPAMPAAEAKWETQASGEPAALQARLERMLATPGWAGYDLRIEGRELQARKKVEVLNQSVSTRTPSPKAGRPDPHLSTGLAVDFATLNTVPTFKAKLADVVARYVTSKRSRASVDTRIETFINQARDNLLWLYDLVPAQTRERSKLWYVGGRNIVDRWVKKFDGRYTDAQMAGALAVMSPKMAWDPNVSLSERIIDIYTDQQDTAWTPEMSAVADKVAEKNVGRIPLIDEVRGRKLSELNSALGKAFWIRFYDEAHNPRGYRLLTPEGGFLPEKASTGKGTEAVAAYGNGFGPIAKVVSILEDGSIPNISRQLGEEHKVRNFYNNIFDPNDPNSVTIDTHAAAAALLLPLGASAPEVSDLFGAAGSNDATGMSGTYVLLAEAYRRAGAQRGVLPREMQSITWEAVRGLFTPAFKTAYAKDSAKFDRLWFDYTHGKATLDDTRNAILAISGNVIPPRWVGSDPGLHEGGWASSYTGELLGPELPRGSDGTAGPGTGGATAAGVSTLALTATGTSTGQATLDDFSPERVADILTKDNWSILTAENPMGVQADPEANSAAQDALRADLDAIGAQYTEAVGKYGQIENSLIVVGITEQQALELGAKYKQDSVLTRNGLQYPDGRPTTRATGVDVFDVAPEDFYTTVPSTGANFALQLDFGQEEGGDVYEQPAYHGTPHRGIDKFSTEKVGTGEGAQAYGWGLYFTGKKEIAEHYRRAVSLSKGEFSVVDKASGKEVDATVPGFKEVNELLASWGSGLRASDIARRKEIWQGDIANLEGRVEEWGALREKNAGDAETLAIIDKSLADEVARVQELKAAITLVDKVKTQAKGQVYEVDIPDDSEMLLWDRPLTEQTEVVRKALEDGEIPNRSGQNILAMDPSGEELYRAISRQQRGDKAASQWLAEFGIKGIKYRGDGSYNYVVFSGDDVAIKDQFYQGQQARGTFNPNTLEIALNPNADLSTFLHEAGHFYLEVLASIASKPGAPQQIVDDFAKVLKWFGVKAEDWATMSLDEKRPHHERWAESFEQYLLEGKAPSLELRGPFQRFRGWLIQVYKGLADFVKGRNLQVSDEVRQVFDRLLATEEQIAEAEQQARYEAIYKSAEEAGMDEFEWAVYQEMHREGTDTAIDEMQARSMADMKWTAAARSKALRAAQAEVKAKRDAMREEVTTEVLSSPLEQARAYIKDQRRSTPEQRDALKDWTDRRAAARERADEQVKADFVAVNPDVKGLAKGRLLAANKRVLANQAEALVLEWEKTNPRPTPVLPEVEMDQIAEQFGFTSGDELRTQMLEQPQAKDLIDALTEQRLLETYGELVTKEGVERAANEAVHNDARARFVATELATMQRAMKQTEQVGTTRTGKPISVNVMIRAAKQFAEAIVGRRKVLDLQPGRYTAAERRAAEAVIKAQAAGKQAEAVAAQRDRLLNLYAARETMAAQDEVKRAREYLAKFDKATIRAKIPTEYLDQIDNVLDGFDLRASTSRKEIDRTAALAAWVKAQNELGIDPILPDDVLARMDKVSFKTLTVDEFRGVVDTVRQIEHLGRLKGRLLAAKDKREFDVIANEIAQSIRDNGGTERPVRLEPPGRVEKFFAGAWADHRKLNSLIHQMDGGKDNGPFFRALVRSMNDAGAHENVMLEKATEALAKLYAPIEKLPGGFSGGAVFIPEIKNSLSRGGRLSIALNWGNSQNRQRVMDGDAWTEVQVNAILATLTPVELKFVNDVWAHIDGYWPEIKAKQLRVSGVVEDKVEAEPFVIKSADGTETPMRGGYYPIKYDTDRSIKAERNEAMETAKEIMRGAVARPTTRRGHTKARVEKVINRPVRKDLSVITQHVNQVVHDLAWHEWFIDANRLMNDPRIASAVRDHYGPEIARTMREGVDAIAVGDAVHQTAVDRLLLGLRSNVTRSVMGASLTTALLQPFGLTQSMARIGAAPVLRGAGRWAGDAARMESTIGWVTEKSEFMRHRSKTFNRELREISRRVKGKSKTMQIVDASLFMLMQKMQLVADIPTWVGRYEQALAQGLDESAAVAQADEAVLASQGGGTTKDLAAVQRDNPFLTQFYSYFSTTMNLVVEKTAVTDFKNPRAVAGWLGDMALLTVVPAILPAMLTYLLKGGGEDDEPEDWAKRMLGWQASYLLGMFVLARELPTIWSPFDYAGPPAGKILNDAKRLAQQSAQGEVDEPLVLAAINFMGTSLGIPTIQLLRSYKGWLAWDEGDAPASSILFGPPPRD